MIEHGLRKPKKIKKKKAKKIKFKRPSNDTTPRKKLSMEAIRAKSRAMDIKQA